MSKHVAIIGIDCAVAAENVAIARGWRDEEQLTIDKVVGCTPKRPPLAVIEEYLPSDRPLLLCLDAPLGWPARLGEVLANHRAGESVRSETHSLFRRQTDLVVKRMTGQQPLDVGADRIARTAEAALSLLDALRQRLHARIPLAWNPDALTDISAIEVYPAATMRQLGVRSPGYKKAGGAAQRRKITETLEHCANLTDIAEECVASGDTVDAVLCVIAGNDFLSNRCIQPEDRRKAEQEGWIWVRQNSTTAEPA